MWQAAVRPDISINLSVCGSFVCLSMYLSVYTHTYIYVYISCKPQALSALILDSEIAAAIDEGWDAWKSTQIVRQAVYYGLAELPPVAVFARAEANQHEIPGSFAPPWK